jgi:hypothetical protein
MTGPVTLADIIHDGKLVWVYCTACDRERDIDPAAMPLPRETPIPEVGKHMKCSACGSRKIDARPELYPGGVTKVRERWR